MVKDYPLDMNGLKTKVDLNIIPLGSYDCLTRMDCLNKHNVFLDHYNKEFTCLGEKGNLRSTQGISRLVKIK
jgi:hypothetical protein